MKKILVICAFIGLLNGCSQSTITPDRYSIIDNVSSLSYNAPYNIKVDMNATSDEGGVVIKTSDVTFRSASNHRWSSDLKEQISLIFKDFYTKYQIRKDLVSNIYINKFYGSQNGMVYIDLSVTVKLKNNSYYEKQFVFDEVQSENGYPSLVEKLKEGIYQIAQETAQELSLKE